MDRTFTICYRIPSAPEGTPSSVWMAGVGEYTAKVERAYLESRGYHAWYDRD